MNNSFEQFFKKTKNINSKPQVNPLPIFKKDQKSNFGSKNKNNSLFNDLKYQSQFYNSSVMSNNSLEKNISKQSTSKSNQKKSKRQDINNSKTKGNTSFKKCSTIQLTKKQKQIREAIEYRFQKSKIKTYQLSCGQSKFDEFEDSRVKQIIDREEEQKFAQMFGYLSQIKVVNLYDYHLNKQDQISSKKEKPNNKIIVIKNSKKKRQNSDRIINFNTKQGEPEISKGSNSKLLLNSNGISYFSNQPINLQSQRNHTQNSTHHRNRSESPSLNFKLQFPSSKGFQKQNGSRQKIRTDNSAVFHDKNQNGNQKINLSSSVQKNFKSIKEIYLNAITNLANKNTVKTNNKLFKSEKNQIQKHELKNKSSKNMHYQSEKKGKRNQFNSNRAEKHNNNSSSALHQNYFSCISSRDNKKQEKYVSTSHNRKPTKQKLDKTVLINQGNPSQWKSIVMKIGDSCKPLNKQTNQNINKFKLKIKAQVMNPKVENRNFLNSLQGKANGYPHSYRQYTKSPKFKRYIISQDESNILEKNTDIRKNVGSVKNLNNQCYQTIVNSSYISANSQHHMPKKNRK